MKTAIKQQGSALVYGILAVIVIAVGIIAYASYSGRPTADKTDTMMDNNPTPAMIDDSSGAAMDNPGDTMIDDGSSADAMMDAGGNENMPEKATDTTMDDGSSADAMMDEAAGTMMKEGDNSTSANIDVMSTTTDGTMTEKGSGDAMSQ